jgi:hypothetical protein
MKRLRTKFAALVAVAALALVGYLAGPALSQWAAITTNSITQADTSRTITVDGGATAGVQIGSVAGFYGIKGIQRYTVSLTPASVATIVCAAQNFTVTGVAVGDQIIGADITATGNSTSYTYSKVTAANTVSTTYCNPTAGALTPAAGPYIFTVMR